MNILTELVIGFFFEILKKYIVPTINNPIPIGLVLMSEFATSSEPLPINNTKYKKNKNLNEKYLILSVIVYN